MKVTSGKFGGRRLVENTYQHIRPTADMVKQAVFNKLTYLLNGARVLDLFCGTGALGIEALSRGAKEAVFVDMDKRSIALTNTNLKNLNISAEVYCESFESALIKLKGRQFDLILLDPPYKAGLYEKAFKLISEYGCLSENGVIVCEHEKALKPDFSPFECSDQRSYGIKMISYLKNL